MLYIRRMWRALLPPLPPAPVRAWPMRELNREEVSLCGRRFPGRSVKPDLARPPAPAAILRRSNEPRYSSRRPRPAMHGATTSHRARPAEGFPPQKRPKVSRFPFSRQWGARGPAAEGGKGGFCPSGWGEKPAELAAAGTKGTATELQGAEGESARGAMASQEVWPCAPAPGADPAAGAGGLRHGLNVKLVKSMRQNQRFEAA